MKEPDRSRGGTFVRDREGKLLEHLPPTRPTADTPQARWTPPAPRVPTSKAATPPLTKTPRRSRGAKE